MSTESSDDNTIRPELERMLVDLRRHIRRYILLEGAAAVLIVVAAAFWISLGLDSIWFALRRLELPGWFRAAFTAASLGIFALTFAAYALKRLQGRFDLRNLALVLERRFPEFDDGLITSVEAATTQTETDDELTAAMLHRTIENASNASRSINLSDVFERRPLHRVTVVATILLLSIVGFGVTNAQAMGRWVRAFIQQDEVYWIRETELIVRAIVQPGDRITEFKPFETHLEHKHPRGADLTLLIQTPDGTRTDGTPWKTPDRLRVDVRRRDGSISRSYLQADDAGRFRFSLSQLQDNISIRLLAGDFTNRLPYRIVLVDAPRIDRVTLKCRYPKYTLSQLAGTETIEVLDPQVSLPLETSFSVTAGTNKALTRFRLQTEAWELRVDDQDSLLSVFSEVGEVQRIVSWKTPTGAVRIAANQTGFSVPFILTTSADQRIDEMSGGWSGELPLRPDSLVRIYLEDMDEISNVSPERLTFSGRVDTAPAIESSLRGIGNAITRKAVIPVEGRITDDYGIDRARFEFRVNDEENWRPRPFRRPPSQSPAQHILARSGDESFERFDVLPLDMAEGNKLTLTVYAADGDNLNGPHQTRSEHYVFRIVSNEELLSILYAREVNLRRRFEQTIAEMEDVREDLSLHRERYGEIREASLPSASATAKPSSASEADRIMSSVSACASRALNGTRKNAGEIAAIEQSFRGIHEELVNNSALTRDMENRIQRGIVLPLKVIVEEDFPAIDGNLGLFKLTQEKRRDPRDSIDQSIAEIDATVSRMNKVLAEMKDIARFHETIESLKSIIKAQQELKDETEKTQKRRFIEKLKLLE